MREIVLVGVVGLACEPSGGIGQQSRNGAKDGALTAARRAEDDGPVAGEIEIDVEREGSERGAELEAMMMPECWRDV